jgi:hypothetical protein
MRELARHGIHPAPAGFAFKLVDHRPGPGNHEHVKTAQGINGNKA